MFIHRHQVPLASVIAITLISTNQASEELNYALTWPSRRLFQSHTRAISHDSDKGVTLQCILYSDLRPRSR